MLQVAWTLAFIWIHALGAPKWTDVRAELKIRLRTVAFLFPIAIAIGAATITARLWSWAYQSRLCAILPSVATQYPVATFGHAPRLQVLSAVLTTVVTYPLFEEFVFRKWLLRPISGMAGPVVGIATTSVLFAALHFRPSIFLSDALFGALLGYAAYATGSIVLPLIIHSASNATLEFLKSDFGHSTLLAAIDRGVLGCKSSLTVTVAWGVLCLALIRTLNRPKLDGVRRTIET